MATSTEPSGARALDQCLEPDRTHHAYFRRPPAPAQNGWRAVEKARVALVPLMTEFTADQKRFDISPYIRRPLRSIRQVCLEKAAKAGKSPECVDCPMNNACQRTAEK
jgi:hypothetical protein